MFTLPRADARGFCQRSSCASDATWMHPLASGCAESLPWPAAPVRCSSIRLRNDVLRLLLVQHLKRAHAIAQANHKPPRACWGLSGLARDHTKPFPAAEECGTHCLDGRGADEVSWDATQRVQSVGAWQLNSAALAPWRHRLRPIAPRDWVEIRCLQPAVLWVMRAIGGALFVRSADQHSERGESKQTSSSSASSMIFPKSLPSFYLSYTRILIRSGSHNGPSPDGDSEMTKSR